MTSTESQPSRPLVGVGVLFVRNETVFLAKRQGSHGAASWGFAGGHLEFGETLEECARREALEEMGVTVGHLRFLCISNVIAYDRHYVDIEFAGDIGTQRPIIAEPEAFGESGWFALDALPQPLFRPAEIALDSLRTGQKYFPSG
ncbi:MAG: DNA mismatch repair protein MutT [SAR202 cluster bacterium Casp-Chloro-G4]|nr:NUDIX domain-containing protein [Chloroflexota bacterium]MDA1228733.1 NUDIX domain-containing protein [Chloroflexota bacterium]PKB61786.1 MAG: DNA mismatch repair protein MutT [SAR202 cluster bacterium Casp-Chloro-G4]